MNALTTALVYGLGYQEIIYDIDWITATQFILNDIIKMLCNVCKKMILCFQIQ